jgi:hypothetical protein
VIAEDAKEVDYLAVEIVIGLDRGGRTVKEYGGRPGERFAVMMTGRQERKQPIEMRILAAIPSESKLLSACRN